MLNQLQALGLMASIRFSNRLMEGFLHPVPMSEANEQATLEQLRKDLDQMVSLIEHLEEKQKRRKG